ncbi:MAG TPA: WYL domain-containing protein [Gammaproteobacteria bacterium]|nr:WYL domain-containing protein [Gammaproteobacteria bacterium]
MDRVQRLYKLRDILNTHRRPVSCRVLSEKLERSESSIKRYIDEARDYFGIPIVYDRKYNGYRIDTKDGEIRELPGLYFNSSELYALLTSHKLLSDVQPGWLNKYIAPLTERLRQLLDGAHKHYAQIQQRVRILQIAARPANLEHFQKAVTALIERKQLKIVYHGRAADKLTERTISPQRLVYYRNNWYLDAWCHLRNGLRSFSIDRLYPSAILLDEPALEISDAGLDEHYARTYGIFAGPVTHTAVLRFSADAARWVADEHWHPQQQDQVLPDGRFELRIPYGDPRELIMDILKYGPDVEVLEPPELRTAVMRKLHATLDIYSKTPGQPDN